MEELMTTIRIQMFFVLYVMMILMIGILTVKFFTAKNKKGVGFLMFIYLIYLVRFAMDLMLDYFNSNYLRSGVFITAYSYIMYVVPLFFAIKNYKKIGKVLVVIFTIEGFVLNFLITWFFVIKRIPIILAFTTPMIIVEHFCIFLIAMNYLIKNEIE